jgi:hypothetical protein
MALVGRIEILQKILHLQDLHFTTNYYQSVLGLCIVSKNILNDLNLDSKTKIYRHIAVYQDTYNLFLHEAKYSDTHDGILRRILQERRKEKQ